MADSATGKPAPGSRPAEDYPGSRLGLPADGPGSVAGYGVRLLALAVDWLACLLIVRAGVRVLGADIAYGSPRSSLLVLATFAVEVALLGWLGGASAGQRLCRLRLAGVGGVRLGLPTVVVRTVLLCLAVPALFADRDGRGLHDRVAGTVVLRA